MIELRKTGDVHKIDLSKSNFTALDKKAVVKLNWKTAIDLDLHVYGIDSRGVLIHIYFGKKNSDCGNISLDHDAGVGNVAGDNEENVLVKDITKFQKIVFVANIFRFFGNLFSSGDSFHKFDGRINIKTLGDDITLYLNSAEMGRWAVIGMIDNQNNSSIFKNVNTVLKNEPDLRYLQNL